MIVIPMKWMPWLLLFCGAYGIFTGENLVSYLIIGTIGGIWLYFRWKLNQQKKESGKTTNTQVGM